MGTFRGLRRFGRRCSRDFPVVVIAAGSGKSLPKLRGGMGLENFFAVIHAASMALEFRDGLPGNRKRGIFRCRDCRAVALHRLDLAAHLVLDRLDESLHLVCFSLGDQLDSAISKVANEPADPKVRGDLAGAVAESHPLEQFRKSTPCVVPWLSVTPQNGGWTTCDYSSCPRFPPPTSGGSSTAVTVFSLLARPLVVVHGGPAFLASRNAGRRWQPLI